MTDREPRKAYLIKYRIVQNLERLSGVRIRRWPEEDR